MMACIIYWQVKESNRVLNECNPELAGVDLGDFCKNPRKGILSIPIRRKIAYENFELFISYFGVTINYIARVYKLSLWGGMTEPIGRA